MNSYIEISIKPDSEMPLNRLINVIYTKLHKALCDLRSTNIGVSFPKYKITLGNVLRIHGKKELLHDLQKLNWIGGMSGYCDVSEILLVPLNAKFRVISRKQPNRSQSKLRRLVKRGSILQDGITRYKSKMFGEVLQNPYVELKSGSNNQLHRRFIDFSELRDEAINGVFDQFGLSKTATVPWF